MLGPHSSPSWLFFTPTVIQRGSRRLISVKRFPLLLASRYSLIHGDELLDNLHTDEWASGNKALRKDSSPRRLASSADDRFAGSQVVHARARRSSVREPIRPPARYQEESPKRSSPHL